jgi:predicted transcriptional regulator
METHPLTQYLAKSSRSVADLASAAGVSRMTIYRLIRGDQNATVGVMSRVSAATGGAVTVADLLPPAHRQRSDATRERAS